MGIYEQHIAKQMHHIHLLWHAGLQEYKFEYLQKQFKGGVYNMEVYGVEYIFPIQDALCNFFGRSFSM